VFSFSHTNAFALMLVVPIVALLILMHNTWRHKKLNALADAHLVNNILRTTPKRVNFWRNIFLISSLICLVIALCGPMYGSQAITQKQSNKEIILCLDLSNSMNTTDILPTRLDRAKQFANKIIDANSEVKIGLVVFAGNAYISTPLTIDAEAIKLNIGAMHTDMLPAQGTAIAKALQAAAECFNMKQEAGRAIVLITDGEDHEEGLDEVIKNLNENDIKLIVAGIGTIGGAQLYDPSTHQIKLDEKGEAVISKLNEKTLTQISDVAQTDLIIINSVQEAVSNVNAQLTSINNMGTSDNYFVVKQQFFQYFLLPAILLLAFYFAVPFIFKRQTSYEKNI
jgi:Ca-activated chloride channel homolog